jgi:hypothetical protein
MSCTRNQDGHQMIELQKWDAEELGLLTPEAVAALCQPAYKFRVRHLKSHSHTPFCGSSVRFVLYVLSGLCTVALDWDSKALLLRAGEFCCVPRGSFVMSFLGTTEYIMVLELPEEVWSQHAAHQTDAADGREGAVPSASGEQGESA